ncbi:MAG: hypothetical protein BGP24_14810 [Lysobacterales bacterium 69-70]|nr:hypothetical protein [Xanthomonadaceae bacterium]ODU35356.1 MAG: hypothetical protein ABS97_05640 [Xanthomonadaceae bacterium SCN 69-320]ODV17181.1 MAG: hypothetical protein ABT27_17600 [Xanthomonadaceae bacterium SCN 69-25]OJY94252.1 MAG: hypothetical protein BGP24_14810 [Xanthomonadales bacterium 69-70]
MSAGTGKTFSLVTVLEVASGRKLNNDRLDGVVELMSHIVGRPLMTHVLPRYQAGCAAWLLATYPQLGAAAELARDIRAEDMSAWLARQREKYGDAFQISPVPAAERAILGG